MSEEIFEKLSDMNAPNMVTAFPGPKAKADLEKSIKTECMARAGGRMPMVMDSAFGATFKDIDGNLFIDLAAGVGVNSVGRGHPKVLETIKKQSELLMHGCDISTTSRTKLTVKLSEVAPEGLRGNCNSFFVQSGSSAVEAAVKFARRITGRRQILGFHGAYHGVWSASGALTTGNHYRKGYEASFVPGIIHAPYPYFYRFPFDTSNKSAEQIAGEYVDYLLNTPYTAAEDVAAVIVESVLGEGGYVAPNPEFLQILRKACDKSGALLIVDEIQAGAGRTGKMWALEHTGVKPDMMIFGKGLGGDLPMAGVMIRSDLSAKLPEGSVPNTFAANGLATEVTLTNLELLQDKDLDLINRASKLGEETMERLRKIDSPLIGEIRGKGLMIGIELVENKTTKEPLSEAKMMQITNYLTANGVFLVPCGRYHNVMRMMPALTIPRKLMFKALDIFENSLKIN